MKDPDKNTIQRLKNGDMGAFDELMNTYEDRIYTFLHRLCGNPEVAADMTQEAFLNTFRYVNNFRGESLFKNWLYKVASNACYKFKRKVKDQPDFELSIEQFLPHSDKPKLEIPDATKVPEGQVLDDELSGHIEKAILELPKKYRLVIVLRDMEGLTAEETAKVLDISVSAVKSRLHRARLFVREQLGDFL